MQFEINVFGAPTFKIGLFKKNCGPPCRADKDEKCTSSGFHSKLGRCLLLSPTTLSPTTADKRLIAVSGIDSQEEGISIPVIAADPLWLSVQFSALLTCGYCSHCHRWFPPWPFTFWSARCKIKLQAQLAGFGWECARFCSTPVLSASLWVPCLLQAAPRVQAVMCSSDSASEEQPDLSHFQLTLISAFLKISHWGLLARKFKLTDARLSFLICLSWTLVHRLKISGVEDLCDFNGHKPNHIKGGTASQDGLSHLWPLCLSSFLCNTF